jgi:integrase
MGGIVGRKRNKDSKPWGDLTGVYRKRKTLIYREYLGVVDGKARFGPDVYLCQADAAPSQIHAAYERITQADNHGTLEWLLSEYHESKRFRELSPRSRHDYADYKRLITTYKMTNGRPFGEAPLSCIKRTTIRGYRDKYGAPTAANRHLQYLSAAWNWGLEWYDWLNENPCKGVKLNPEKSRTTYITDAQYEAKLALCSPRSFLPLAMELAYLCRLRANEVYAIKREHIEERGLRVFRGKGSLGELTLWTPRLRAAVDACKQWNAGAPSPISGAYLIHDKRGRAYTMSNHKSQWQRLKIKADAAGLDSWTFHDLKAKGVTDQERPDAGHLSPKMRAVYDRKGRPVMPADGEGNW